MDIGSSYGSGPLAVERGEEAGGREWACGEAESGRAGLVLDRDANASTR
jgi:hypothetical protein